MRHFFAFRPLVLFLTTLALGLLGSGAFAQAPVGRWELHPPGNCASRLTLIDDQLYISAAFLSLNQQEEQPKNRPGQFGLFRYDLEDGTMRLLTRQDGLADVKVSAMGADTVNDLLVIAYLNANLDILDHRTGTVTNLSDIQRKAISGTKRIHSINVVDGKAYLACSFGVVVVNLKKQEIADAFVSMGAGGQALDVRSTAIYHDSLFAATDQGIFVGSLNRNLLDFANWRLYPGTDNARSLAVIGERFYVVRHRTGLFRLVGRTWAPEFTTLEDYEPMSLTASRGRVVMTRSSGLITTIAADGSFTDHRYTEGSDLLFQGLRGRNGNYYLADPNRGLLVLEPGTGATRRVLPNGPVSNVSFFTLPVGADTYALTGGYNLGTSGLGFRLGFSRYRQGRWENFSSTLYPDTTQYPAAYDRDLTAAAWNPTNNKLYIASYGNGLLEWGGPGNFRSFTPLNSPLISSISNPNYTRLKGVAVDSKGVVWMTNFNQGATNPGLFSFDPKRDPATAFTPHLAGLSPLAAAGENLIIDDNGYKWMTISQKGTTGSNGGQSILVYDETRGLLRTLSTDPNNGGVLGDGYVTAICKDRKGDIWIGTGKGVQVFYNTASVFPSTGAYKASQPIIDRRPLLDGQQINAIAVDGGNRKWVGTSDGLWLFSEDGTQALADFTTENSPLPSNKILSLSVNGVTGEVFVGTEVGLATYRGGATEPSAEEKPACTKVFPNPVPARFAGQVAIDGLTNGATVKITDISGKLVFETTANGGRAVWDCRDYNGRRVRSGIYTAFSANADGEGGCVSKIAVMGE